MFDAGETGRQIREALAAFPDDASELPDEVVGKGFAELQRVVEAVEAKRLRWLADQDRRASYRKDGYLSTASWLADGFGVAAGTAKAQVKVSQALREMPQVREAFSNGEMTSFGSAGPGGGPDRAAGRVLGSRGFSRGAGSVHERRRAPPNHRLLVSGR